MARLWMVGWGRAVTLVSVPLARVPQRDPDGSACVACLEGCPRSTFGNYPRQSRS